MAEVEEEEEASTQLSTLLPPAEVQQRENKAWQDVFDTPANRSAETVGMLLEVRHGCGGAETFVARSPKIDILRARSLWPTSLDC